MEYLTTHGGDLLWSWPLNETLEYKFEVVDFVFFGMAGLVDGKTEFVGIDCTDNRREGERWT